MPPPDHHVEPGLRRYAGWSTLGPWMLALCIAFCFDRTIVEWVAGHHLFNKRAFLIAVVKAPGDYWLTTCVAILILLFHDRTWRGAALPMIAGALGGLAYSLVKWMVGRRRPVVAIEPFHFHPFIGGLRGLFREPALSFPSGHTSLAFATAASLAMLLPRWRVVWFAIACCVGAERLLENAHYLSDVVAGAGVGLIVAKLSQKLIERLWPDGGSSNDLAGRL